MQIFNTPILTFYQHQSLALVFKWNTIVYMSYRKDDLVNNEIYHVFNRGVDKRIVFEDKQDFFQFLQMLDLCNVGMTCGGVKAYKYPSNLEQRKNEPPLVEIIAYCLNGNHYHLLLKQISDDGISRFMQKIGTAYTKYFNQKNNRTGSLFQGKFKSVLVDTDQYLKGLSAYINLNNLIHLKHQSKALVLYRSSWWEYGGKKEKDAFHKICKKKIILDAFKNKKIYMQFANDYVKTIISMRKDKYDETKEMFLE